ncbi:hypothetical protein NFI96_002271 [Prochilodus magdalenae]|nr:hypothetical protein NFI96_002271 [Prochilodus magdalenae]
MVRGSPIPPLLRRKKYQNGVTQRKIEKTFKLSSSTVHNIIKRFRESRTIVVRKGQGRKTLLDARDLRALKRHCTSNRNATVKEITEWAQEYFQKALGNKVIFSKMDLPPGEQPLTLSTTDVCHTLRRVSARKAAGPDEVPGRVLKACAEQLAGVFTDIFNLSLAQVVVPTIFKTATIVPVPKHSTASTLNDFRPVALTPIISKCFERLVSSHVKSCLPAALDLHQFAYRRNRSTEDAISAALNTVLSHLDCQNSYVRMLFIDFSSAFKIDSRQCILCMHNFINLMAPCCQPRGTLNITGSAEKIVRSTKFLCVHITENLTWYFNTNSIAKRAQQSLYFLHISTLPSSPCFTGDFGEQPEQSHHCLSSDQNTVGSFSAALSS